jgi:MFS family permease
MIAKTWTKFKALSPEVKNMLGSYWVYELAEQIIVVFMGIFVYTQSDSLFFVAIYFSVYFTMILLGFTVWGLLMTHLKSNMKWNHIRAFTVYIAAFVWFWFFRDEAWHFLVFGALNGLGLGIFWLGHHTFEMLHTSDGDRDFYSSMLGAGSHVTAIVGPLIATLTFFISQYWFDDPLSLIFFILPFTYILAVPFLWKLPSYVPEKISKKEIQYLRKNKDMKGAKAFAFIESTGWGAWEIMAPLMIVTALETYVNIGIFDTLLGVIAILVVVIQGHLQHKGNRKRIFHISMAFVILYYLGLYFWTLSPWVYILLGLFWVPVEAIYNTVVHVVFLKNIDQMRGEEGCFYAGLLYREWIIWLGRIFSLICIGTIAYFLQNDVMTTYVAITWIIAQSLLMMWSVEKVLKD